MTTAPTAATDATPRPPTRSRLVGITAVAVATGVFAENAVLSATGAPSYATPVKEVLAYYAGNRAAVAVAAGLVAAYLPLLLLLLTSLQGLLERRGGRGSDWGRLAVAAGATFSAGYVLLNVTQIGVALSAGRSSEPSAAVTLLWQVHAAAFGLALPMLGASLVGMALATHASGLTPAWQRVLGLVGAGSMFAAGLGSLAIADGSPLVFVGLVGLACWLAWLLTTGVRLVRRG